MVEMELLPLQATSLFSKVTSLAGEGYQIYLVTNPEAHPLSTFETKMATRNATRSISAILRKNKGLWIVKLC